MKKIKKEKDVEITVTIGLEVGSLLLMVGDYYDASNLVEGHAENWPDSDFHALPRYNRQPRP